MPRTLRRFYVLLVAFASLLLSLPAMAGPPAEVQAFLDDVFSRIPAQVTEYQFVSWSRTGKPTKEGVGLLPAPGINAATVIAKVMDVDHYVGNIEYVAECRSIADARYTPPSSVRFYQRVDVPLLGAVQHELVLVDGGTRNGYRYAYWYHLAPETEALSTDVGARSQYSVGAWIIGDGVLGYALSNAPRRDDVSWTKWQALTTGADLTAGPVVKGNLEGMLKWAK